ncbi:hypothetical protein LZ31DRAFT_27868 [Colletotrichum somersetense]|nr:hypothetical protein LZ31DRAFT_27868 [Colletotrichum somersetense]
MDQQASSCLRPTSLSMAWASHARYDWTGPVSVFFERGHTQIRDAFHANPRHPPAPADSRGKRLLLIAKTRYQGDRPVLCGVVGAGTYVLKAFDASVRVTDLAFCHSPVPRCWVFQNSNPGHLDLGSPLAKQGRVHAEKRPYYLNLASPATVRHLAGARLSDPGGPDPRRADLPCHRHIVYVLHGLRAMLWGGSALPI